MSEEKTWEETKAILDDPFVSADTKQAVLESYAVYGDGNDAAESYYEEYGVEPHPWGAGQHGGGYGKDPDELYEAARTESERAGYHDRQVRDRLQQNQTQLDGSQAPAQGGGGVGTSDELFDLAEPALEVFQQFVPIDNEAPGDCKHIDGPINYDADIKKRYDEQRGIDFRKFLDEAQKLRDAHATLTELNNTTESSLNSLYKDWSGDAATASHDKYTNDIAPNVQELLEYLEGSAEVIEETVRTVYTACKEKADQIAGLYTSTIGAATPEIARQVMKLARGEFSSQDEVLDVAAWVDAECGSNIESTIRADGCGLNDENKTLVVNECKTWIQQSWNPDLYENLYTTFKQTCDDTKEAVDSAWQELANYLKEYESKFPEAGADLGVTPPAGPGDGPGGTGGIPGGGTGGMPGGGTGGMPGGGTGGMPGGGGGTPGGGMPEVEQPELEGATGTGTNPITGKPLEVDPETGEPYPIDPETGEPITDAGADRDTLTVEKGEHSFEMTEPDDTGKMEISVDDGSGEPKEYALDFGNGPEGPEGPASTDGPVGTEGLGGEAGFGPQGSEPGQGGEQVYRPGPDGKIYIQDGDLKITAEQPEGPDGPTKVTVDDGNPPPTTYTLGEAKGENPAGGAGGGTARDQIRTMPAQGENPFAGGGAGVGGMGGPVEAGGAAEGGSFEAAGAVSGSVDLGGDGLGEPGGSFDAGGGGPAEFGGDGPVQPGDAGGGSLGGSLGVDGAAAGGDGAGIEAPNEQTTSPQAIGMTSGGGGGGGEFGAAQGVAAGAAPGEALSGGLQSGADAHAVPAGAGLGAAPGGMGEDAPPQGGGAGMGSGAGGMGMMGGMGAMGGAGGGQGDDQQRSNPFWFDGGLFETTESAHRISGTLGDEDAESSVRFDR